MVTEASYIIFTDGAGNYYARNGSTGKIEFSGTSASAVIQNAIDSLPQNGGKILLKGGKYILANSITINKNSIHISGENTAGDLFFTTDDVYHGQSNKSATLIIANGIDAFHVGSEKFVFGITIENLFISGLDTDEVIPDTQYSIGAGIKITRADTVQFNNIEITRKEYGFYLNTGEEFAWDKVIDVLRMNNIYLAYNVYGIWQRGWLANARIQNIFGYINQKSLLNFNWPKYDILIENIWSNADAYLSTSEYDAPISITTSQDLTLRNVWIAGLKGSTLCPVPLIRLSLDSAGNPEWYRAHVKMFNLNLFSTASDAIRVSGKGQLDITDLHAGSTGSQAFPGGAGTITYCIVSNMSYPDVVVNVERGYANSLYSPKEETWFTGVRKVANVNNFNPVGKIASPFNNTRNTIGLWGGESVAPNKEYTVWGTDLLITSSGGTGVNIIIKDQAGNVIKSGLTSLTAQYLPVGYKINFGNFSVAPTVTVSGN
jgi:hypothetical protein